MIHECTFKTYVASGREYYEYSIEALTWMECSELETQDQPVLITKDFPFLESLLSLLYLDVGSLEPLVKRIEKAIREFLPSNDDRYAEDALTALDELAGVHVYFELVRLEWRWRFAELKASSSENRVGWLPRKRITHIPSDIAEVQQQILDLFDHALNMDGGTEPLHERMANYYRSFDSAQRTDAPREPFELEEVYAWGERAREKTRRQIGCQD